MKMVDLINPPREFRSFVLATVTQTASPKLLKMAKKRGMPARV